MAEDGLHFYRGRVLRIDSSAGVADVEPLNSDWAELYIGGKGLLLGYGRLFNVREGVERDDIPALLCESIDAPPGVPRKSIGRGAFHAALNEYYELRGWDEDGVPTEAKLEELAVDVRLPGRPAGGVGKRNRRVTNAARRDRDEKGPEVSHVKA